MLVIRELPVIGDGRSHRLRNPKIGAATQSPEPRRRHTDDSHGNAVDADGSTDDRRVAAETALPQRATEHRHGM